MNLRSHQYNLETDGPDFVRDETVLRWPNHKSHRRLLRFHLPFAHAVFRWQQDQLLCSKVRAHTRLHHAETHGFPLTNLCVYRAGRYATCDAPQRGRLTQYQTARGQYQSVWLIRYDRFRPKPRKLPNGLL